MGNNRSTQPQSESRNRATNAEAAAPGAIFTTRKLVHVGMLGFALLLPFLTWAQAAGAAVMALLFNIFLLPRMSVDLRKPASTASENLWTGIILYPAAVLALIALFPHRMDVVGGAWAILALGDGAAGTIGSWLSRPCLPWNAAKSWEGFAAFVAFGAGGALLLMRWIAPGISFPRTWHLCLAAAVAGAMAESLPIRLDDNATVPLVTGCFLYAAGMVQASALAANMPYLPRRLEWALAVNAALALVALSLRTITISGAALGWLLGIAIYLGYGARSFALLLAFFVLGSVTTRLGYAVKRERGIAERREGARSWREALANLLPAAFFSVLIITTPHEMAFRIALAAALAEAAGDTAASEVGQWLSSRAYLITTGRPAAAGVDGGVSLPGSLAGVAASAVIAYLAYGLGVCHGGGAWGAFAAGLAGNLTDSLLGATLQRRGLITNGVVNFASSAFAGALALAFALRAGF